MTSGGEEEVGDSFHPGTVVFMAVVPVSGVSYGEDNNSATSCCQLRITLHFEDLLSLWNFRLLL